MQRYEKKYRQANFVSVNSVKVLKNGDLTRLENI